MHARRLQGYSCLDVDRLGAVMSSALDCDRRSLVLMKSADQLPIKAVSRVVVQEVAGDAGGHCRSSERFGLRDLKPETEMTMTDDRMARIALVERPAEGELMREMLVFAAGRIMEAELGGRTGAAKGARTPAPAPNQAAQHEPDRALEQGSETPRRRHRRSGLPWNRWPSGPHSRTRRPSAALSARRCW